LAPKKKNSRQLSSIISSQDHENQIAFLSVFTTFSKKSEIFGVDGLDAVAILGEIDANGF